MSLPLTHLCDRVGSIIERLAPQPLPRLGRGSNPTRHRRLAAAAATSPNLTSDRPKAGTPLPASP